MALTDLNRPKLKKYSPKGVTQKGRIETDLGLKDFSYSDNTHLNSNITLVKVPKRHKPSTVNYFTDHDAMGFTKNMQIGESKFIGISEDWKNYVYPDTLGQVLGIKSSFNIHGPRVNWFPKPPLDSAAVEIHAEGFTKFFNSKLTSQFLTPITDTESGKTSLNMVGDGTLPYTYPVVSGNHQGTFRLGDTRSVTGLGNVDVVDYFSGIPGKWGNAGGESGTHTLPLGFWKNIGKDNTELPHNSRSQLAYMVTEGDLAGKYVFGFGPPTSDMAVDSPHMWQLSSKSIIPDVPNTWDVRGQTMWDQMGEYPWAAYNQPSLQSKGVNFMAGTKKGKTFNPDHDLHPYGFTTNMGKLNWQTGDPNTGVASRLAIPIDENGDRSKIKISANLDGLDGYDFPYPGQGSWHIRKHYRRRSFQPTVSSDTEFYEMDVPDSQANYPIWSNMNLEATKETAKKASESLNINEDSENITKLNTLIGASTYKVPRIGSEIARKFLHPTAIENSDNKFSYIDHYWRWKTPEQIREEAAPGKMQKDQIHPIIYKSLIDMEGGNKETFRWSGDTDRTQGSRATIEFIRGGVRTSINRIKADQHRLKTILFGVNTGWQILGKQALLQALNPREETRVFNPLSFEANATRVVKLQRHISAEGVLNTIKTSILNPIKNFLDPGSVSPVTLGLYERYEGFDWGPKNRRDKGNKLAQWANESFESEETAAGTFGDKLKKGLLRGLRKSFTSAASSITGYNLEESPEPPSRYVDSQKTLSKKKKLTEGDGGKGEILEATPYDKLGNLVYGDTTQDVFIPKKTGPQPGQKRVDDVGHQGKHDVSPAGSVWYDKLGFIPTEKSSKVDKINMIPYGDLLPEENPDIASGEYIRDFIKFRFKDMQTGANLVFRAILSGINDNITPEWSSERYIGRADSVHVYRGADRNISFNFSIAPKTKTEFPILMEKLNYLIGLCYPDYDSENSNRMVPPMTQLTIGSILDEAPGFLNSLSYTVEESSNWEIQEGLQFPKFINVSCDFRYIGKSLPNKHGQHFGIHTGFWRTAGSPHRPADQNRAVPIPITSTAYESILPLPDVPDIGQYNNTGGIGKAPIMELNMTSKKSLLKPGTLGVPVPVLERYYLKPDALTIREAPKSLETLQMIKVNRPKTGVLSKLKTKADYLGYKGQDSISRAAKYTFGGRDNTTILSGRTLSKDLFGVNRQ